MACQVRLDPSDHDVVVALAGAALFQAPPGPGSSAAGLAMLANSLRIPYARFRAVVLTAINGSVIWALCTAPSPFER
ncbi:hypothetical protein HW130_25210 [Streptomyces sp. PKU-EA00015]|uniref:hypothetical protein n=1 Tax=Streptomyces sp. PKU-EA00015 TaxID=2748326 RepID=UPI0015A2B681|nr:hypothetical protein [Streptomyces sp. PKU-EA00015]NWF29513.1 hypothetical protein [Streptomyces sp. PKU-EA00015]